MTAVVAGTTHHLMSQDKRKAAEVIVQENAGAKLEEQSSEGDEAPSDS